MKRITSLAVAVIVVTLVSGQPALAQQVLVIDEVNVVPMSVEGVLPDRAVEVVDGRISRIGPAGSFDEPGARRIDGGGRYLLPGLMDMHVHVGILPTIDEHEAEVHLRMFLGHGVMTVRVMSGSRWHLALRDEIARGDRLGPRLVVSSPMNGGMVPSPEAARQQAREFTDAGYDLIKHVRVTPDVHLALVDEARLAGIPVGGHVHDLSITLEQLLGSGVVSTEHVNELLWVSLGPGDDEERMAAAARAVARSGVTVSTLLGQVVHLNGVLDDFDAYLGTAQNQAALAFIDDAGLDASASFDGWRQTAANLHAMTAPERRRMAADIPAALRFLEALDEAGANIVIGTDSLTGLTLPGRGLHDELALFERAGLEPAAVLRAATVNAVKLLGRTDSVGTIEIGQEADLILADGNPLEDLAVLREPVGLLARTIWLDAETLNSMRQPR